MSSATLPISPLAVPFPAIPEVPGVAFGVGRAGLYPRERDDVLLMRFDRGTVVAGVFTRHGVGSAPVDWCKAKLKKGPAACALVVNAGCANSFTGKAGAKAAAHVAAAAARAVGCARTEVMLASTGVIGQILDDKKITPHIPAMARADGELGRSRPRHLHHRHLPQGRVRRGQDRRRDRAHRAASPRARA